MSADRRSSSSPSRIADAFNGDIAARLLPVAGFARIHAASLPTLLTLSALELRTYLVLVMLCDGWRSKEPPRIRTEDLCELLKVTRRRVLLAIAQLVRKDLVRRQTAAQAAWGGCAYDIVQPGAPPRVIEKDHSSKHPDGSRRITLPASRVIPPLPSEGGDTLLSSRSDQPVPSPLQEISLPPSLPPAEVGGGEAVQIPKSWVEVARRLFPKCHSPEKFLVELVEHGFNEEDGRAYLERAAKAHDLPPKDHQALAVWCSAKRRSEWLDRRRRQQIRIVRTGPPEAVDVVVLSPAQLVERARAALNAFSTPEPRARDTGPAKIDSGRSSPEQTANLGGTLDVAEGGAR